MVGSGHAALSLRQDWREYTRNARNLIGFDFVRFHGIFDDDMSVVQQKQGGGVEYSWHNVDEAYAFLLSIGMKPLVELSFMPELLAANSSETIFHYKGIISPPKSHAAWADFIEAFARHIIYRFGAQEVSTWLFEVWNEPNCGFFAGTQSEYFHLYEVTVRALKKVSPLIRVGGPATCQSQWIPEFKKFIDQNNVPADYVTTHQYPTDIQPEQRGILKEVVTKSQAQAFPLDVYYTEFNSGLYSPGLDDDPFAAAFLVFNAQLLQSTGIPLMSYWCVSDVFEEQGFKSPPFHEGFGLQTHDGVAKPAFRAMELLSKAGEREYHITAQDADTNTTVSVLATDSAQPGDLIDYVFISNYQIPQHPIAKEAVCLRLPKTRTAAGGKRQTLSQTASIKRIDEDHGYAKKLWKSWGSPSYISTGEVGALKDASMLSSEPIKLAADGDWLVVTVTIPPQAVAVLELIWLPSA